MFSTAADVEIFIYAGVFNPRPAGVFIRTRPAGGGQILPPLPNSRTNRRSEAGEAAIESPEREDSNAH